MDFESLYTQYFQKVYNFAYSLTQDVHQAEEVTQETFFRAMKHPEKFEGRSSVNTYLCAIAHNLFISSMRKQKKYVPETVLDVIPSGEDIEAGFERKDTSRRLHQLLHRLEDPYKEVFTLRVFGELPFAAIGALFDKGESWARVTFFRAKQKMQETMKEENGHE